MLFMKCTLGSIALLLVLLEAPAEAQAVPGAATPVPAGRAGGPGGDQPCGGTICDGPPFTGSPQFLSRPVGEFWVDSPVLAGEPIQLHARGPVGWRVFYRIATECTPSYEPAYHGYAVVSVERPPLLLGELPASGALDVSLPQGNLFAEGARSRVLYLQADFYNPSTDTSVLATPSVLVAYRPCP